MAGGLASALWLGCGSVDVTIAPTGLIFCALTIPRASALGYQRPPVRLSSRPKPYRAYRMAQPFSSVERPERTQALWQPCAGCHG